MQKKKGGGQQKPKIGGPGPQPDAVFFWPPRGVGKAAAFEGQMNEAFGFSVKSHPMLGPKGRPRLCFPVAQTPEQIQPPGLLQS